MSRSRYRYCAYYIRTVSLLPQFCSFFFFLLATVTRSYYYNIIIYVFLWYICINIYLHRSSTRVYIRDNNNNICFTHKATGKGHAGRRHFWWVYRPTAAVATTTTRRTMLQVSYLLLLLYSTGRLPTRQTRYKSSHCRIGLRHERFSVQEPNINLPFIYYIIHNIIIIIKFTSVHRFRLDRVPWYMVARLL